jgi:2-polyprenyl-6-methoxyphenol hydroxylase-like FAD-dependent oxidoreductase
VVFVPFSELINQEEIMNLYSADVVIVGGGPVGLVTAIALRGVGADVLLVDAQEPPIDKPCGEGLMPDSRQELSKLGIELAPAEGARFTGIRFADPCSTVSAEFAQGAGLGIRRLALHQQLLDCAATMGVRMRWRTRIELRPTQQPILDGKILSFRYLVGADGGASQTRVWAELNIGVLRSRRFGFRAHFEFVNESNMTVHPGDNHVEVHWGDKGQAYVTPIGDHRICIAVVSRSHAPETFKQVIDGIPILRESLSKARQLTPQRGAVTTTSSLRRVVKGNVTLVGDASGSVDAITGEGLAMGFRQARLLRDSIMEGGLDRYQAEHAEILRRPQQMARILLMMDGHPGLRCRVLRSLAARPELFTAMFCAHLQQEGLLTTLLWQGVQFGRQLLLPAR